MSNMTLLANSTFLPILDDLLSPDFRPVLLPAQTPQTPSDVVAFGGGKIITNAFGNITFANEPTIIQSSNKGQGGQANFSTVNIGVDRNSLRMSKSQGTGSSETSDTAAAAKIQNWWKSKRSNSFDVKAERIKHSIRHSRTEDHIRYLEAEVSRLKSALSSERKIRSLQLEAIRSLWSQVQRISTVDTAGASSLMTRSVPNGLPKDLKGPCGENEKTMSMSMNAALEHAPSLHNVNAPSCPCTKEVQYLRESLTQEMSQLRAMIDQLTTSTGDIGKMESGKLTTANVISDNDLSNSTSSTSQTQEPGEEGQNKESCDNFNGKQPHKRPFSLNLTGISSHTTTTAATGNGSSPEEKKTTEEEKEQIVGYANQMASKLVDDAIEDDVKE